MGTITPPPVDKRMRRRVILAASIGTGLELYDFAVYGLIASLVLSKVFFPATNPLAATLGAFGTLAIGYVARPLGGMLFGHFGDRLGRKKMLQITMLIMGIATALIGFLPTFAHIGVFAPIALVALRLLQGMAVGGEQGAAWVTLVEHAPAGRRGLWGSFATVGSSVGQLLAVGVILLMTTALGPKTFADWGWRLPFLAGIIPLAVGTYIRRRISETPVFTEMAQRGAIAKLPVFEAIKSGWRNILLVGGVTAGYFTFSNLAVVYGLNLLTKDLGVSSKVALVGSVVFSIVTVCLVALAGWLSDIVGRPAVLFSGMAGIAVFSIPFFLMMGTGNSAVIIVGMALAAVPGAAYLGPIGAYFSERFSATVRYSGVSMGYQLGATLGGGFAPLLGAVIYSSSGGQLWALGIYALAMAGVGCGCVLLMSWNTLTTKAGRKSDVEAQKVA